MRQITKARGLAAALVGALALSTAVAPVDAAPTQVAGVTSIDDAGGWFPAIAHNPERDEYLAVYVSTSSDPTAVRLDRDGRPLGAPVVLGATAGADDYQRVRVAYNAAADEYLAVWSDARGGTFEPGSSVGFLFARRISATGVPLGAEIQLTGYQGNHYCAYRYADVAADPGTGGYVVTGWLTYGTSTPGFPCAGLAPLTQVAHVFAVSPAGAITATRPLPKSLQTEGPANAAIARNPVTGEFLVGWSVPEGAPAPGNPKGSVVQRLSASLALVGEPIVALPLGLNQPRDPLIAADPLTGNWLVAAGLYPTGTAASVLSPSGAIVSGPHSLSSGTSAYTVAATAGGHWVVGDRSGGVAQVAPSGLEVGRSLDLGGSQLMAVAAPTAAGRAVVVWSAFGGVMSSAVIELRGGFQPIANPTRILDTRVGLGAPARPVGGEEVLRLDVTGVGGVPASGVDAVVLNLTATNASAAGYVTVWPSGTARPDASVLNVLPGVATPNLVVAKVGADGTVAIYNNGGPIDLIGDVAGWYAANDGYVALSPERLLDTRSGVGAPAGPVRSEGTIELQVTGRGGVPGAGVDAVVLNVTAVGGTAPGYVTAWPTGAARPDASALNVQPGIATPNLVVAKVGAGGKVSLYNYGGEVHLLADVAGWYPVASGLSAVTPSRVLDTRTGIGGPPGAVGPNGTVTVRVAGRGGVPATGVGTVVLNVTATQGTATSYVTAWPSGQPRPDASVLNVQAGVDRPNLVFARLGPDGAVSLFNESGDVHLLADVVAWMPG